MTWSPEGIPAALDRQAAFSISDLEDSDFPKCPARIGIKARRGRVRDSPEQQPFDGLLTAMIKDVVVALARGRTVDPDGGLGRAAASYRSRHPLIREFLDAATLNYLEFLEAREQEVGPLTYVDYSFRRDIATDVSLKLWAPVYTTAEGVREVHRLRHSEASLTASTWATSAAWIASEGRHASTVIEFGLGGASDAPLLDGVTPKDIRESMRVAVVPSLQTLLAENEPVSGSHCVGCDAVALCPALIPLDMFGGLVDATSWVRSVSESDLTRYRTCPAKARAKSLYLPADRTLSYSAAIDRGTRVHRWIAERHAEPMPCLDALLIKGTGVSEDDPYLAAHADQCDRSDSTSIALEQTLVGWDRGISDVVFMKPDELRWRGDTLILREIKTTMSAAALDSSIAWEQHSDVAAWWLSALMGGLDTYFGGKSAELELEILTPEGGAIHRMALDDPEASFRVEGWRLDTPSLWLGDRDYHARPGALCEQCEVVRWCREGQGAP